MRPDPQDFGDFEFVESELRAPPPRIELVFIDDNSLFMQSLVETVRRDKSAADLGIQAVTDRHQVGSKEQVDAYLSAADKGRYVNTAWATGHGCATADEADRRRIEGLGVYCIVKGSDLMRAYLAGDADLGVAPLETFVLPPDRTLSFETAADKTWRTRFRDEQSVVLDPSNVVGVRALGRELHVDLNAATGEALVARARNRDVVALDDDRSLDVEIDALAVAIG